MKRNGKILTSVLILAVLAIGIFTVIYSTSIATADTVGRQNINDIKYTYYYSLTGTAPYVRFINKQAGTVWDNGNGVLAAAPTWTDTDIVLTTKMTSVGGWLLTIPATLPDGAYDILVYDVSTAAGSRANTDAVDSRSKHAIIKGARIVQLSDI